MTEMTLAEYKAQVDAKYAKASRISLAQTAMKESEKRKDHWLLVGPNGEIDGIASRQGHASATEAFEMFFEKKKDRHKAAAEGWHIEQDDIDGTRWAATCAEHEAARA
ncbi:hypothetical protein [Rhodococcus globerulus]|uniref:Uncharacterized protein n=1 Tax=Rhodococcus globerulus TaxID=33008 RepID=A0ABU4BS45_RHOGO|nr:hypothetical protein [Rhodococcus globerulus]MDV6267035.1 hypothetical protein [Rhodococcus globerulus]